MHLFVTHCIVDDWLWVLSLHAELTAYPFKATPLRLWQGHGAEKDAG